MYDLIRKPKYKNSYVIFIAEEGLIRVIDYYPLTDIDKLKNKAVEIFKELEEGESLYIGHGKSHDIIDINHTEDIYKLII